MKDEHTQPISGHDKLTTWEWEGLGGGHNIADGHAHQGQSPEYRAIIGNLGDIYLGAESIKQKTVQKRFEQAFFKLAGQKSYKRFQPPLYQAACSLSIEVVANYLRKTGKSVALLHPTFDNLADILKRHDVKVIPLEEQALLQGGSELEKLSADALFLVCPNNPTGTDFTEAQLREVVAYCKRRRKLLILDCSFRFYSSLTGWDQYEMLSRSGIDFIVFEDTGKTWPTLELKIGITVASDSVYQPLSDITNDFLLNVSPFMFRLLTEYIQVELRDKKYFGAKHIAHANRNELKKAIQDSPLEMLNPDSPLSVAWIKLPSGWRATRLCNWLGEQNVHTLPGSPFYWADHKRGESYIRIALLRPCPEFKKAMQPLRRALKAYQPKNPR